MTGHKVVLGLGSNVAGGKQIIETAISRLCDITDGLKCSATYRTRPVSGIGDDYMNAVVFAVFHGEYDCLNALCKEMEVKSGRDQLCRAAGKVPLDIDIVVWDNKVLRPGDFERQYFQIGYKSLPD